MSKQPFLSSAFLRAVAWPEIDRELPLNFVICGSDYVFDVNFETKTFLFKRTPRKEVYEYDLPTMLPKRISASVEVEGTIEITPDGKFTLNSTTFSIEHRIFDPNIDKVELRKVTGEKILALGDFLFENEPTLTKMVFSFLPQLDACRIETDSDVFHSGEIVFRDLKHFIDGKIYEARVEMNVPWIFACPMIESVKLCIPIPRELPPEFDSKVMLSLEETRKPKKRLSAEEFEIAFGNKPKIMPSKKMTSKKMVLAFGNAAL